LVISAIDQKVVPLEGNCSRMAGELGWRALPLDLRTGPIHLAVLIGSWQTPQPTSAPAFPVCLPAAIRLFSSAQSVSRAQR